MATSGSNPFNLLLGIMGVLFTITACCYCMVVVRGTRSMSIRASVDFATSPETVHPVYRRMQKHGEIIRAIQLGLLAVATCGAVAVDQRHGIRPLKRGEKRRGAPVRSAELPEHSLEGSKDP